MCVQVVPGERQSQRRRGSAEEQRRRRVCDPWQPEFARRILHLCQVTSGVSIPALPLVSASTISSDAASLGAAAYIEKREYHNEAAVLGMTTVCWDVGNHSARYRDLKA